MHLISWLKNSQVAEIGNIQKLIYNNLNKHFKMFNPKWAEINIYWWDSLRSGSIDIMVWAAILMLTRLEYVGRGQHGPRWTDLPQTPVSVRLLDPACISSFKWIHYDKSKF